MLLFRSKACHYGRKSKFVKVDIISKMWTSFTFDQFKFREHNDLMLCVVLQGHAGLAAQGTAVHGGLQVTWPRGQDQEDNMQDLFFGARLPRACLE